MELLRLYLPVLFPSWRFFGEIGASPRVEYLDRGRWRDAMQRPERLSGWQMLVRLVWSPDWNEALYLAALAERLIAEPQPWISGEIGMRLQARHQLPELPAFRVAFVTPDGVETVYESSAHGA